jgi:fibronectin-binding autotransporter adhesin
LILCSTAAFAQATFRYNVSGTDWQDSGNWIQVGSGTDDGGNGYPDGLDEALFDASSPIPSGALTNTPASVAKVTLNGFTGTVQINSGFDLTVTNTTTINGGTLTLNDPDNEHSLGVFALSNGTFNGAGIVQMTSATISGGTFNGNDGTYQTTSGGITVSGGTFHGNDGTYQTTSGGITVSSGMFNGNNGSYTISGGITVSSGMFNGNNGSYTISGGITVSSGTFNGNNGSYTIAANQQLAISGGTFNAGSGSYYLSINQTSNGIANITVFNRTGGTFNRGTSFFTVTVNAGGTGTKTAILTASDTTGFHNLTITSNDMGSGRVVAFSGSGTFTIHNELKRTGRLTNVTGSNLQYASGATLKYGDLTGPVTQSVSGEWPSTGSPTKVIRQSSNSNPAIMLNANRTIPSGGFLEVDGGKFTIGGAGTLTIELNAEVRLTSDTLTINSGGTLTVNGALKRGSGILINNNGTLTYGTTGTQTVGGNSYTGAVLWYSAGATIGAEFPASPSVPNLLITTSDTVKGSASRTVRGIFRMTTGTLSLGSNTLTVLGDISGSAVAGIAAIANSTTLNLGGGSTSTLAQTISGNLTLNKLTINKQATGGPWASSNTVTVSAGASITFTANGTLTIQNGTLAFGSSGALAVNNLSTLALTISVNGILKTGGQDLDAIGGSFTVNGKIVFNGTNTETLPRNRTIARIEIDNSNNVQVSNASNNIVTVTDSLIFTSGRITQTDTTNYLFVLGRACKVSGSGYVDGPVRRVFPTTGTGDGIVPTGRSTGSSPSANWITLNFSQGSDSATLRFEQINGNIGGPTSGNGWSARSTTRYWKIEVVSGSISSPSYGITVQKANSGIATPRGRILRSSAVPATSTTFETSFASSQTDNGTTVATPNNAYANFLFLAFTIVRDTTGGELIWRGLNNSWKQASNWWLPNGDVSPSAPTSTTSVIINGARPGNVNTVMGNATVLIDSTANCQSLTVGDTTGITTSTLEIAATLNVNVGSGYNPANTTFGQNSTIVWKDGSGGVQADAYQNLTVENNSALGTQGTGSITVSGNMVKQGSGTFTPASGNAITVSGNYTNTAGNANYSNASLTLNTGGTTFALTSDTVSGNVTLSSQTIQLYGGTTMSANLTLNGSGTQTINGNGTTSLAGLTVTNGIEVNLGGQTRTVVGNVALNNSGGKITNGTLRMAGTSAQSIGGTSSVSTVANLQIDNSSGVTLNRPLELTGTLTMTNGNLTTTTTNILTTPATSGGSASSFVNGPLSISGNSYPKNYPIGKSTAYRPISINSSGSDSATIRAEMINMGATSSNLPDSNLFKVSQVRYFSVDLISGSVSSPTITITYGPDDGVTNLPNLCVARSTNNNHWFNAGVSNSTSSSITSNSTTIEPITYFALGSITNDNPLPVQLSSFTLTPRQRSIEITWQTESESENKGFIILRSESETGGYQEIASYLNTPALVGQGTTASPTRYRYIDNRNIQPGRAYWYKLVDVDYSGRRHEHQPMSVQTAFEYALDQNYPNPFNPSTAIQFSLEKPGKTVLEIYNTLGQKVATLVNGELSAGAHRYQWNASGLASGVYFYRLQSNEFVATKKMILVK